MEHERLHKSNSLNTRSSSGRNASLQLNYDKQKASNSFKAKLNDNLHLDDEPSTHWYRLDSNHKIKSSSKTKLTNSIASNANVFYDLFNSMPELKQFQTRYATKFFKIIYSFI